MSYSVEEIKKVLLIVGLYVSFAMKESQGSVKAVGKKIVDVQ
jgi:hypothetical protein